MQAKKKARPSFYKSDPGFFEPGAYLLRVQNLGPGPSKPEPRLVLPLINNLAGGEIIGLMSYNGASTFELRTASDSILRAEAGRAGMSSKPLGFKPQRRVLLTGYNSLNLL